MRQTRIRLKNKNNYYCLNLRNIQNQQSKANTHLNFQGREREGERQTDKQRHTERQRARPQTRQLETETDTNTDRQTGRDTKRVRGQIDTDIQRDS